MIGMSFGVLLLAASGFPAWSAVLFIVGAGIWLLSLLVGFRRTDPPAPAWIGIGTEIGTVLMIAGIGLAAIFGA